MENKKPASSDDPKKQLEQEEQRMAQAEEVLNQLNARIQSLHITIGQLTENNATLYMALNQARNEIAALANKTK